MDSVLILPVVQKLMKIFAVTDQWLKVTTALLL